MTRIPSTAAFLASTAALLLATGCSQPPRRAKAAASAPTLADGAQAHIRGVSDPNAQFTLLDRRESVAPRPAEDAASTLPCHPAELQVYEAGASMNGASRVLTLAVKNRGAASCRLSGSPQIELQDENGHAIASIAIRQTGALAVSGSVVPVPEAAPVSSGQGATGEVVEVVLRPSAEANFRIRWSSGEGCPLVSSFSVALSGGASRGFRSENVSPDGRDSQWTGAFTINHALNVCNSQIEVTLLRTAGTL